MAEGLSGVTANWSGALPPMKRYPALPSARPGRHAPLGRGGGRRGDGEEDQHGRAGGGGGGDPGAPCGERAGGEGRDPRRVRRADGPAPQARHPSSRRAHRGEAVEGSAEGALRLHGEGGVGAAVGGVGPGALEAARADDPGPAAGAGRGTGSSRPTTTCGPSSSRSARRRSTGSCPRRGSRRREGRRRRAGFSSGSRRSVPVRTPDRVGGRLFADWGDPAPGLARVDFAAHSGVSAAGAFVREPGAHRHRHGLDRVRAGRDAGGRARAGGPAGGAASSSPSRSGASTSTTTGRS